MNEPGSDELNLDFLLVPNGLDEPGMSYGGGGPLELK